MTLPYFSGPQALLNAGDTSDVPQDAPSGHHGPHREAVLAAGPLGHLG